MDTEKGENLTVQQPVVEPNGLNLEGLESSDEDNQAVQNSKVDVEVAPEERHEVLLRQVEMQCNTFGEAAGSKAAAAQNVTMGKLLSLGTGGEKCVLYIGWVCAALTGLVLPMFIFFIGPVFDAFAPGEEAEDSFKTVATFVGIMGGLASFVFLTSYLQHNFLTKGSILIVRRIKKAYLESILKQESSWFDLINHTELASRVS